MMLSQEMVYLVNPAMRHAVSVLAEVIQNAERALMATRQFRQENENEILEGMIQFLAKLWPVIFVLQVVLRALVH